MRQLRLLIISIATICVFALAVYALVNRPPVNEPDDEIIIKGGSMEIQCGKNHGTDCLGTPDATGKYKHKQAGSHIRRIVIKDVKGKGYDKSFVVDSAGKGEVPTIVITYK
jgi:hypothetical protein